MDSIEQARERLAEAERVVVLTGAGISAESGVPTFRGEDGLWRNYRPEQLATPEAFARDPRLVWEWYGWRRERIRPCRPNAAHLALARWRRERAGRRIVTQNVDGLHSLAAESAAGAGAGSGASGKGTDADGDADAEEGMPLELHGSLFRVRCTGCGERRGHRGEIDAESRETLPHCGTCGELLRPDVVWFGESLDPDVLTAAFEVARAAEVCLVIGTSALVHPAASLPLETRAAGGAIIEVNPDRTPLTSEAGISLRERAAETVPRILGVSGDDAGGGTSSGEDSGGTVRP